MNQKLKKGGYSAAFIAIVIAIVVAVNMIAGLMPEHMKQIDVSGKNLYELSDTTIELLDNLQQDVTLYVVGDPTMLDERIQNIAERYGAASSHIKVENLDPVLHPSVLTDYEAEDQTILVSCEATGKKETIHFYDIVLYDQMAMYYGQYQESEFDGEGQISSAIAMVTNESNKKIYTLEGHQEADLTDTVKDLLAKSSMEIDTCNLLTGNGVPEDADMILMYAPQLDLAEDEREMLSEYLHAGGQVMILAGPSEKERPNLNALTEEFGLTIQEGYLADMKSYYRNNPYYVFPTFETGSSILSGISSSTPALLVDAMGMTQTETLEDGVTVTPFLTTTDQGVLVKDENTQEEGSYLIGAVATKNVDEVTGRLTVVTASSLISDIVTQTFSNVSNLDIFMNAVTAGFDDVQNISVPAKSLAETYNTVLNGGTWGILFIAVIPIILVFTGLAVWMKRRRL